MGTRTRKRPDESRKPGKITAEGFRALEEESGRLWNIERPKVRDGVSEAAAEGDRSENAEYIYGKIKLAGIDRKLKFLGNRMDVLTIVAEPPPDDGHVHFGSWVVLEDEDGEQKTFRIVGADESDIERGFISEHSPLALALMGHEEDDEVTIKRPKGDIEYIILEISVNKPANI